MEGFCGAYLLKMDFSDFCHQRYQYGVFVEVVSTNITLEFNDTRRKTFFSLKIYGSATGIGAKPDQLRERSSPVKTWVNCHASR